MKANFCLQNLLYNQPENCFLKQFLKEKFGSPLDPASER